MITPVPPRRRGLARWSAAALTVGCLTAAALVGAPPASASSAKDFPGAKPSFARTANERGSADAAQTVEGEIAFSLRNRTGAVQLAQLASTPGNPLYRKYSTPSQWIARFSPTKRSFDLALDYLRSNHLLITGTPKSRLFITFRGTVEQVEKVFSTDLKQYTYRGHRLIAPSTTPSMPDAVSQDVNDVYLGQLRTLTRPSSTAGAAVASADGPTPVSLPDVPCSTYWQQHTATLPEAYGTTRFPTANCGYLGSQFRSVYGVSSSMTGAGQKVAIIDAYASPTLVKDYRTFVQRNGGTALTGSTYTQITPKHVYDTAADLCGGIGGWQGEQVLDVTAVHGIAPKAKIVYVGGFNCGTGLDVAMSRVLDDRLATIVSNSYGNEGEFPEAAVVVNENQHLQAAAEGIGLYFSSGDDGDNSALPATDDVPSPSADYPATSPYVTAVGGTTTEIAANGTAAVETGWGNFYDAVVKDPTTGAVGYESPVPGTFASGAGGGVSAVFGLPWYQQGVVSASGRGVPDVAADADPRTGELIGLRPYDDDTRKSDAYTQVIYGGTSLSSPLFAAEVALVQQRTHRVYGFLNPLIYADQATGKPVLQDVLPATVAVAYNDQFKGNTSLVTGNMDTSLKTTTGWDQVTGLGVLRLNGLGKALTR